MQDSYWIALLGIIMVSLKTKSPNAEPIKTLDPGVQLVRKNYPFSNIPLYSLWGSFSKETKIKEKNKDIT